MYDNTIYLWYVYSNESCLENNNNICFTIKSDFYAELWLFNIDHNIIIVLNVV